MTHKEIYYLPAENEEITYEGVLKLNAVSGIPGLAVGDQCIHALVPADFQTAGTVFWETGMPEPSPDSEVQQRFAGFRT